MRSPVPTHAVLGANMGVQRMTKEHLGLAVNLALPSFVVITKIDISPDHVKQQTLQVITRILKSGAAGRKMPMVVKTEDDVVTAAREVGNKKMVPIFFVSNVTGEGIDMLKQFLNLLPSAPKWEKKLSKPAEFQIDESFQITVCRQPHLLRFVLAPPVILCPGVHGGRELGLLSAAPSLVDASACMTRCSSARTHSELFRR